MTAEAELLATLCGDDENAALAIVERLGAVIDQQYSRDVAAAVSVLVTSLANARRSSVRAASARAISKLACWPDSPAGPINMEEAERVIVVLCQAITSERERDVRLAIIEAIEKQARYRSWGPEPDPIDTLLIECAASDDIVVRHAAQRAILFRTDDDPDGGDGSGDEAIIRMAFARDKNEFVRFLAEGRGNDETDWSRLLKVGETTLGWVEDAIGPPDDLPYAVFRKAAPCPSVWKYDLGHPAKRLFVFRFDATNRWRLSSWGYEESA